MAFSNIGTQEDLFVARTDGSETRQLTNDPEKDRGPSWSRDGKLLYFYSQRGKRYETWSIHVDGSGLRQVSHTRGDSMTWPRIMPDGRSLYEFNSSGTYLLPLNPDGTATRIERLPPMPDPKEHFVWPSLSPDGRRFAGATGPREADVGGIWVYSLDTKRYEQLTDHGFYPEWTPDGKWLLFLDGSKLAMVDVASKQVRSIPIPRPISGFALAPDGRALYLDERTAESDIWLFTAK
jgi:Tol biopolymer transport system component